MDVGDAAFSVPPQQLITHDGGIIEIGAEARPELEIGVCDSSGDGDGDDDGDGDSSGDGHGDEHLSNSTLLVAESLYEEIK